MIRKKETKLEENWGKSTSEYVRTPGEVFDV